MAGDAVTVLADVAERPEEIDVQAAEADRRAAEAALGGAAGPEFEHQRAKAEAAITCIIVGAKRQHSPIICPVQPGGSFPGVSAVFPVAGCARHDEETGS